MHLFCMLSIKRSNAEKFSGVYIKSSLDKTFLNLSVCSHLDVKELSTELKFFKVLVVSLKDRNISWWSDK